MESLKNLYRIDFGPSSSHTIGPRKAAKKFLSNNEDAASYRAALYGSLAATGRGHLTDKAILDVFAGRKIEIDWFPQESLPFHPNGMIFTSFDESGTKINEWTAYSVGGGKVTDGTDKEPIKDIYPLRKMAQILQWSENKGKPLWEYVEEVEGKEIWGFLAEVWSAMQKSVKRGVNAEGSLPGDLNLGRKASYYYVKANSYAGSLKRRSLLFSYALAVAEENAGGGKIVTAPTCGSCGVLPAVLYLISRKFKMSDEKILRALATAGIVGNLIKKNASISGAQVGCQGEIGAACAMAAAGAAQLFGGTPAQVEYAAESGLEHHLGLTCDPVGGLVQIPCIERNAFAAARALDSATFAILSDGRHRVTFDKVVETMNRTGHDIPPIYRETSEGGLAIVFNDAMLIRD